MLRKRRTFDLTFVCRRDTDHFALPILRELERRYKIQYIHWDTLEELETAAIRAPIVWYEWLDKGAYRFSRQKWLRANVVFRLHRYELDRPWGKRIQWRNNFRVVFVNKEFENSFRRQLSEVKQVCTISNAVLCEDFPLVQRSVDTDKHLCLYSKKFEPRKGYREAISLFSHLLQFDADYRLNLMAGKPTSETEANYLAKLYELAASLNIREKIDFELRQAIDAASDTQRVNQFLRKSGKYLGFSKHESFQYTMAEAILTGQKAFYCGWVDNPAKHFWEPWAYNSEDEMIDAILTWDKKPTHQRNESLERDRRYVQDRFDAPIVARQFEELLFPLARIR